MKSCDHLSQQIIISDHHLIRSSLILSCLRDIRDRSVLRIFETAGVPHQPPAAAPVNGTSYEDSSYFSEPEFDGDYQSQHVHKAKVRSRAICLSLQLNN